jgi:hypothetical protein
MSTQHELTTPSPLLTPRGRLAQVGWARQPLLDCNLEAVRFYPPLLRPLQRFRVKRWDYYGVTTPHESLNPLDTFARIRNNQQCR